MRIITSGIALLVFVLCLPATAMAGDDAPYSPAKFSVDELIVTDRFSQVPLIFPWEQVSSDRINNRGRMDFEMIYDIDYDAVNAAVTGAYEENDPIIGLDPEALPYTEIDQLRVMGTQLGQSSGRFTVGHPDLQTTLTVDFEPDGERTRVIVQNGMRTRQFSGFVPARVEFQPEGAESVPFRLD